MSRAAPWTPEREAKVRELWLTHSCREIAKALGGFDGCMQEGRLCVSGKAFRLGLPPKTKATKRFSHAPWRPGDPKPEKRA